MTRLHLFILLLAVGLPLARAQEATSSDTLAPLVKSIASEDAAVRAKAYQDLVALGKPGVAGLLGLLVEPGKGDDGGAQFALHGMASWVSRPGGDAERKA